MQADVRCAGVALSSAWEIQRLLQAFYCERCSSACSEAKPIIFVLALALAFAVALALDVALALALAACCCPHLLPSAVLLLSAFLLHSPIQPPHRLM